jgi:hypothetical protein
MRQAWHEAPLSVRAFVAAPTLGVVTNWAYNAHARAHPDAFAVAAGVVALLTAAIILGRRRWAWALGAVGYLVNVSGLIEPAHRTDRPLWITILLDGLFLVLLFSPPMLDWVGVSLRLPRRHA